MRIRIAVPALAGAIALGALTAPAASATTTPPKITKASFSSLVIGLTGKQTLSISVSATDNSGIKSIKADIYPANSAGIGAPTRSDVASSDPLPLKTSGTTGVAHDTHTVDVAKDPLPNLAHGTWYLAVLVTAKDGGTAFNVKATTFSIRNATRLTADAAPEPVRKGRALTVAGRLTWANWDKRVYQGYGKQTVTLQFRKYGAKAWTNVKNVVTGSTGVAKTTVTAQASGTWRYVFKGNGITGASAAAGDYVTVK